MTIDYDCFGYCALCHKYLMTTVIIDNKPEEVFTGDRTDIRVELNDGSKMTVTLCQDCKSKYNKEAYSDVLMKSVIKGWEHECSKLVEDKSKPEWTQEKKEAFMNVYSKKEIV